jgi:TolA-binding protein
METNMNRLLLAFLLGSLLAVSACSKKEESRPPSKVSAEDVKKETKEAIGTAMDYAKQERDGFASKAQKDLDELNLKIEELKKKAQEATGEAKAKLDEQIKRLQQEQKAAAEKLDELKSATGEAWKDLKAGVQAAIDHLKQSAHKDQE